MLFPRSFVAAHVLLALRIWAADGAAFHPPLRSNRDINQSAGWMKKSCERFFSPEATIRDEEETVDGEQRRSRRDFLSIVSVGGAFAVALCAPDKAEAATDPLFRPNPLTNPVLEQFRIWEQAEADDLKYGGELAAGSPKGRETYAKLLVPILAIERDLNTLNELIHREDGEGLPEAARILDGPQYQKVGFKKVFNAFADNIYYSDPDRANAYLGGGATPKNEQSIAYLLRNEILTNVEALQAEVEYLNKEKRGGSETLETEDLYQYIDVARRSMVKYLELIPPGELKLGRELIAAGKK